MCSSNRRCVLHRSFAQRERLVKQDHIIKIKYFKNYKKLGALEK